MQAQGDVEAGWYMIGFRQGSKIRRDQALLEIDQILIEEAGARDALAQAFENLKKYEHVAEAAKVAKDQAGRQAGDGRPGRAGPAPGGGRWALGAARPPQSLRDSSPKGGASISSTPDKILPLWGRWPRGPEGASAAASF
jgi:hypothetical protein